VRIGHQGVPADAPYVIAAERGYFERQGLDAALVPVGTSADMVAALAERRVDLGGVEIAPSALAALAGGLPIRLVADHASTPPGHGTAALVVRQALWDDGQVRDLAGLPGRAVAYSTVPQSVGAVVALSRGLASVGLADDAVRLLPLPLAGIAAAFAEETVDAALLLEPAVTRVVRDGAGARLVGTDALYPYQQLVALAYAEAFYRERPEAGRRFLVAYLQAARDYRNAFAHRVERAALVDLLVRRTSLQDAGLWEAMVPVGRNPNGHLNVESAIRDQEWHVSRGNLSQPADLRTAVDHSFVDYALGVVGPYRPPR
jgi:NitT/TauT family transport system substrate-binding protein